MRKLVILSTLALLVAVCGGIEETATTIPPSTPIEFTATTTSTPTIAPTSSTTTTLPAPVGEFTVEDQGRVPDRALGDTIALGSGCSPGGGDLPDGVWFGWIETTGPSTIEFDLACCWAGRTDPAVGNDSTTVRALAIGEDTMVYPSEDDPIDYRAWLSEGVIEGVDNAPGLPDTTPFWVFVNNGLVTEMTVYPGPIDWARSEPAWPDGVEPGCCDGGDVVPPSPSTAWPESGWPADGFYDVTTERSAGSIALVIRRYLSCRDNPGLCPEWWVGDEVLVDMDEAGLDRVVPLDDELIVVIKGIGGTLVGNGTSYAALRADIDDAVETWIKGGEGSIDEMADDPSFPFGYPSDEEGWPHMYRGPGGAHLTFYEWWPVLEIRDGSPILYFHAGLIAG